VKDIKDVQRFILRHPELGFQKALNQVILFFKITIDKGKFDVDKDFYDGRVIPITQFLDDDARASQPGGKVGVLERTTSE